MKLAVVSKSGKKDGVCLFPSHFGEKIEFIARGCGEFKEGEIVVALECVHDTKPEKKRKGARFIKVRRLTQDEIEDLASQCSRKQWVATDTTSDGELVIERRATFVIKNQYEDNIGYLTVKTLTVKQRDIRHHIRDWGGGRPTFSIMWGEKEIALPEWGGKWREILKNVFGYNVAEEQEKARRKKDEEKKKREKEKEKEEAEWVEEKERRKEKFLELHPEALEWFSSPPSWEEILEEAKKRDLLRFIRTRYVTSYVTGSKSFTIYDAMYELQVGDEVFEASFPYTKYEYGDD